MTPRPRWVVGRCVATLTPGKFKFGLVTTDSFVLSRIRISFLHQFSLSFTGSVYIHVYTSVEFSPMLGLEDVFQAFLILNVNYAPSLKHVLAEIKSIIVTTGLLYSRLVK